ncbi:GntR family transcriptional regulator [Cloacibacillus sp. An23]|nr:GntR family transcriptional regulator [Cloacibacillus sp. An23]
MLPNEKLPSLREMANIFQVSIGTVQSAYDSLEHDNFIYSIPKKGYFVLGVNERFKAVSPLIDFFSGSLDTRNIPIHDIQQCMLKAINLYTTQAYRYTAPQGHKDLLKIMKTHLEGYQVYTDTDNIVMVSGSQQALDILCRMPFPNGKDKVLVEQPTYYGVLKSLEVNNTPREGIKRGFEGLSLQELDRIFHYDNIKFFYTIPRFHNPTGQSYTIEEKQAIVKLAKKYNVYIVEDDIAADFDTSNKRCPLHYYDIHDHVIYIKSFSKIVQPGLRIAAIVLPQLLLNTFIDFHRWTDTQCATLSQSTLAIYLSSGMFKKNTKMIRDIYVKRMAKLQEIADTLNDNDIEWSIPDSGFYACMKINKEIQFDQIQLELLKNRICLMDTRMFFLNEFKNNNYLRISISKANEDEIALGINKLVKIIKNHLFDESIDAPKYKEHFDLDWIY